MEPIDPRIGTVLAGGYRLEARIGAGGMGIVYRAVREPDGRTVAVKLLHESFLGERQLVERFDREVKAMRRLQHVRLVEIIDSGHAPSGAPFLVMELLDGVPLSALFEGGAVDARRALRLMLQILDGVGAAHAAGVVHRDLKPDNVLILGSGEDEAVKILDFGLAKIAQGESATGLTHTGLALGTPSYMAPEQGGGGTIDHRADLYALGVLLYQMIVGRKPFQADAPIALLRMHMDDTPPRPSRSGARLSKALEAAILRALEKAPDARFADAAAFADALNETPERRGVPLTDENLAGDPTAVGKRNTPAPKDPSALMLSSSALVEEPVARSSNKWVVVASTVALLAIVGAIAWMKLAPRIQPPKVTASSIPAPMPLPAPTPSVAPTPAPAPSVDAAVAPSVDAAVAPSVDAAVAPDAGEADDEDSDDDPEPPRDSPGAQLEAAAAPAPAAPAKKETLRDAAKLVSAGNADEAVQMLYRLRRASPRSPEIALWLGHAYFRKLWRTDGLREYGTALTLKPSLKRDPLLVRNAVVGLESPTTRLARALIKKKIGAAALPELRKVIRTTTSPKMRARINSLGQSLAKTKRR